MFANRRLSFGSLCCSSAGFSRSMPLRRSPRSTASASCLTLEQRSCQGVAFLCFVEKTVISVNRWGLHGVQRFVHRANRLTEPSVTVCNREILTSLRFTVWRCFPRTKLAPVRSRASACSHAATGPRGRVLRSRVRAGRARRYARRGSPDEVFREDNARRVHRVGRARVSGRGPRERIAPRAGAGSHRAARHPFRPAR